MFKTIEVATDCEIRSVIRVLNARNVLPSEIHHQICQVYGDNVMSDGMVRKLVRMFNKRREMVHDEARSGRPSLMNDDLVRKVNEGVRDDRLFTIPDLSLHFLQFSRTLLYYIVSSCLGYRKVCAQWVPKMLTEEHKKHHFACSLAFLMRYHKEGDGMLSHIVTGDDTGVSISNLNQNSSPCTGSILARQKRKSSSRCFQQGRSCAPYSGTDKVFSW